MRWFARPGVSDNFSSLRLALACHTGFLADDKTVAGVRVGDVEAADAAYHVMLLSIACGAARVVCVMAPLWWRLPGALRDLWTRIPAAERAQARADSARQSLAEHTLERLNTRCVPQCTTREPWDIH